MKKKKSMHDHTISIALNSPPNDTNFLITAGNASWRVHEPPVSNRRWSHEFRIADDKRRYRAVTSRVAKMIKWSARIDNASAVSTWKSPIQKEEEEKTIIVIEAEEKEEKWFIEPCRLVRGRRREELTVPYRSKSTEEQKQKIDDNNRSGRKRAKKEKNGSNDRANLPEKGDTLPEDTAEIDRADLSSFPDTDIGQLLRVRD